MGDGKYMLVNFHLNIPNSQKQTLFNLNGGITPIIAILNDINWLKISVLYMTG